MEHESKLESIALRFGAASIALGIVGGATLAYATKQTDYATAGVYLGSYVAALCIAIGSREKSEQ